MSLGNVKRKVDQFTTDMRQFMRQVSGQAHPSHFALEQMARGTSNGMPNTLPASIVMSTDLGEQSDFCRMARGSAGVAELVAILEQQPWVSVESLGTFAKRKAGVLFEGQPWSVAKLTKEQVAEKGHLALEETVMILGQIYKIALPRSDVVTIKMFVGPALKCSFEASKPKGRWQTWELLGIEGSDSMSITSLMSPKGEVAIAAFHEGKDPIDEELSDEDASKD